MSQLVPCPACERHVRLSTPSCPFCDAALDVSSLEERYASRRRGAPAGAKRAAVFALGAGLAAACGDDGDSNAVPVYGAPVSSTEVTTDEGPAVDGGATTAEDTTTGDINPQPLYGAPIDTSEGDNTFVAIYGAPVSPVDAGPTDTLVTSDAALNDAGPRDAGLTDSGTGQGVVTDSGTGVQPVYGAPIFFDAALTDVSPVPSVAPAYGAPPSQQN